MEKEYNEKKKNEKLVLELLQLYDISSAKGILAIKEMLDATEYDLLKRLGKVMFRCIENEINVLQIQELFSNYIESDMHSSKIEKKIIPNDIQEREKNEKESEKEKTKSHKAERGLE